MFEDLEEEIEVKADEYALEESTVCDYGSASKHVYRGYFYGFKEGAKFVYNKMNEWHYVKDGDLPKDDENFICMLENGYRLECFYDPTTKRWYDNFFRHDIEYGYYQSKVVAWKEIVLPELKETEQ